MLGPTSTAVPLGLGCAAGRPERHAALDLRGLDGPQSAARGMVRSALKETLDEEYRDDVVLVADELVGNAVEHAGEAIDISLDLYPWGTVIQVRDGSRNTAAVPQNPVRAGDDEVGGRGLFLVNALASAWRVQRDDAGKRVVAVFLHQGGDPR